MKRLKPGLKTLKPHLSDVRTPAQALRQKLYQGRPWRALRRDVLTETPYCVLCKAEGRLKRATVVDHIDGHDRPDWLSQFYNRERLQTLCDRHHREKTAHEG